MTVALWSAIQGGSHAEVQDLKIFIAVFTTLALALFPAPRGAFYLDSRTTTAAMKAS